MRGGEIRWNETTNVCEGYSAEDASSPPDRQQCMLLKQQAGASTVAVLRDAERSQPLSMQAMQMNSLKRSITANRGLSPKGSNNYSKARGASPGSTIAAMQQKLLTGT